MSGSPLLLSTGASFEGPADRLDRGTVLETLNEWSNSIRFQIVSADIDGLLTACLLNERFGWPLAGYYDTKHLWLQRGIQLPLDMKSVAWVGVDMTHPDARCISQHVVCENVNDRAHVKAFARSINPSLLLNRTRPGSYEWKYPYSTLLWAWWLLTADSDTDESTLSRAAMGTLWLPDGGAESIRRHTANCLDWLHRLLPGNPIRHSIPADDYGGLRIGRPLVDVAYAESSFRNKVTASDEYWSGHQFRMSRQSPAGPITLVDPVVNANMLTALLAHAHGVLGFDGSSPTSPAGLLKFEGEFHTESEAPEGWQELANSGEIVSISMTGFHEVKWTTPGESPDSLLSVFPRPGR